MIFTGGIGENAPAVRARSVTGLDAMGIAIDPARTYQTVDGFGYTLTGGSALHIAHLARNVHRFFHFFKLGFGQHFDRLEIFLKHSDRVAFLPLSFFSPGPVNTRV